MLVLRLVYNNNLDFVKEIQELRSVLKKKNITIGIVESVELENHIIKIYVMIIVIMKELRILLIYI